ncbi:MAG: universal stress protein [Bacteroidales bacterium]|nr:universal stress protein [Bacteroidales bacterium]
MTNFVVPIDFSVDSLKGLEWAILFSKRKNVNIQMVYVLSNSSNFQPSVVELEQKYAEAHFKKLMKEHEPRLGNNSKLRYIIKKGKIYREVVNQVNSYKNAVVSASTHGASGFEELFIGSNALKIMAATEQPVFTVRTVVPEEIRKIVVPIKLHLDTRQKAPMVADIAELFGAELHVVSISTHKNKRDLERLESYSNQVMNYFDTRGLKTTKKNLVGESLPSLTCNYSEAVDADLITIMSSAIDKWNVFLGSYAQQMVKSTPVPLLSITPKEKQIPAGFSTLGG